MDDKNDIGAGDVDDKNNVGAGDVGDEKAVLDPCQFPRNDQAALNQHGNDKIDALLPHYDGLPQLDKTEWQLYKHKVVADQNLVGKTAIEMMRLLSTGRLLRQVFPNLVVLAKIYQLIPISTANCKRGFSTLGRIKTKSRNSLSTKMLNTSLLL